MTDPATTVTREPDPALDPARAIADAVLYEGYVLFPYRASALKNRYRWQWGVLVPAAQVERGATEPATSTCQVPLRVGRDTTITVTARFLHLRRRQVLDADGDPVDQLEEDDGTLHVSWDEGIEREVVTRSLSVDDLLAHGHVEEFGLAGSGDRERLARGGVVDRSVQPASGRLDVTAAQVEDGVVTVTVTVTNTTPWSAPRAPRDEVLRRSLVGTHLMLSATSGTFGSVIDPPDWAAAAAADCHSRHVFPVLVQGDGPGVDVVLASPIILEDHPVVADESPGPSFDGLEIDELLALCVQGLSDDEKRQARATDPRAAEIVDRAESLPPAVLSRLHGTVREFGASGMLPEPEAGVDDEMAEFFGVGEEAIERVDVDGVAVVVGDTVLLRPRRRADVHDLFADGHLARVEKIVESVDGPTLLAVTLVDDPAAELHRWYGRFQYFHLDEVVPQPEQEDVR